LGRIKGDHLALVVDAVQRTDDEILKSPRGVHHL
jgi:hypothetical protein